MKNKIFLLFVLLVINSVSKGQIGPLIFSETISFETPNSFHLRIDTSQIGSIWEIGIPAKTFFSSSYSNPNAIFTDTGSYPNNNYSYFDLIINDGDYEWYLWGEGILGFWHKYDTDTLTDGCFMVVSYDGGGNWFNIINDPIAMSIFPTNFYSQTDTIIGNIPAFSGHTNDWTYSEFYWYWEGLIKQIYDSVIVRFCFKSDSINNNKEGWLIDQILFNAYMVVGDIEIKNENDINIYPNPTNDKLNVEIQEKATLEIINTQGQIVYTKSLTEKQNNLDLSNLVSGVYTLRIKTDRGIAIRKLIKQ